MNASPEKNKAQELLNNGMAEKARLLMINYCKQQPNDAEAFYILGQSCAMQNDYEPAKEALQTSINLFPSVPVSYYALACIHQTLGELDAALEKFKKVLSFDNTNYKIELYIVSILITLGKEQEAKLILNKLQKIIPDDSNLYVEFSRIEHDRYNLDKAVSYLNKALMLDKNSVTALIHLASIYTVQAKTDLAKEYYLKADKLLPKNPKIISGLASVYSYQGDFDKAIELITPLIQSKIINFGIAKVYISVCKQMDSSDKAVQYVLKVIKECALSKHNYAYLYYELGREHDRLNKFDDAFNYYKKANNLSKAFYNENENIRKVTELIEVFSKDNSLNFSKSDLKDNRPVFIIGMPRSGTSLTEQILASHPDVHAGGELSFIGRMAFDLSENKSPYPYCVKNVDQNKINELAQQYLNHLSTLSDGASRVTNKMPRDFYDLGLIALLFPNAYIIHCKRNSMDNCLSIYFQNFGEGGNEYSHDLKMIANYYIQYQRLMDHWTKTLKLTMLSLNYEEVVSDQENQTRRLLEFCNLEWHDECLSFHELKRTIATASYNQVRKPLYAKSVNRWEHYEKHIKILKELL